MTEIHAVTGPFSYTGKYIARRLVDEGLQVRGFVRRSPHQPTHLDLRPLQFTDAAQLTSDLEGVRVLFNTYWIRFGRGSQTFDEAVRNIAVLAEAAAKAGVRRIVHISVSNPSVDSPFAYFRGKAQAESAIKDAGVPCSIVRPTLVFGDEDILINNIAWIIRRFHVFLVPPGPCRSQPVFVEDVAKLCVDESRLEGDRVIDAAGPEILPFSSLLKELSAAMRVRCLVVPAPTAFSIIGGRMISAMVHDVTITHEELGALRAETLVSLEPPTTSTRFSEWLSEHENQIGQRYRSELQRHWQIQG